MFLYARLLLLLPTAALAVCNDNTLLLYFDALDANNDNFISKAELNAIIEQLNINQDQTLSKQELKERLPLLDPDLTGKEEMILNFFDADKDGEGISQCESEVHFKLIDKNKDGVQSREEFQNHRDKICSCGCP